MNANKFTQKMTEAVQAAQTLAQDRNHAEFDNEHILLAILDQPEGVAGPVAGLAPDPTEPGYRRTIVAPRPTASVTSAKATIDGSAGMAKSCIAPSM